MRVGRGGDLWNPSRLGNGDSDAPVDLIGERAMFKRAMNRSADRARRKLRLDTGDPEPAKEWWRESLHPAFAARAPSVVALIVVVLPITLLRRVIWSRTRRFYQARRRPRRAAHSPCSAGRCFWMKSIVCRLKRDRFVACAQNKRSDRWVPVWNARANIPHSCRK